MTSSILAPLYSIQAPLLQTLNTSYSYLATGAELLHHTIAMDAHLKDAFVAQAAPNGTEIFLDCHRMNLNEARRVFLEIRELKEKVEVDYPLLGPVTGLLDYMSHMTVNILPATEIRPRKIAEVATDGSWFAVQEADKKTLAWSIGVHFGISPDNVLGETLDLQNPNVVRALSSFGLGVYAYLGYTFVPALGSEQCLTPMIAREWSRRRIAPAKIRHGADGSYFLDPR